MRGGIGALLVALGVVAALVTGFFGLALMDLDEAEPTGEGPALALVTAGGAVATVGLLVAGVLVWLWPKIREQWSSERALSREMRSD